MTHRQVDDRFMEGRHASGASNRGSAAGVRLSSRPQGPPESHSGKGGLAGLPHISLANANGSLGWLMAFPQHREPQFEKPDVQRICLKCRKCFESEWSGERICKPCKGSGDWKQPSPYVTS